MAKKKANLNVFLIALMMCGLAFVGSEHFGKAQFGTYVNGIVTSDTTWTQTNSPYTLTGPVGVNAGVTLTIQSGVTVNIGTYYLQVNGTVAAMGVSSNPIIINGNSNVISGYPGYVNSGSSGYEIIFSSSSIGWNEETGTGCIIQNVILNYVPIEIDKASPKIDGNLFSFNQSTNFYQDAIGISGGSPTISNNTIIMNSSGKVTNGISVKAASLQTSTSPTISNNKIIGIDSIGYGIYSLGNATILKNSISGWEMGISSANDFFSPTNNTIIGNLICGNNGSYSYGIFLDSNDISIVENNTITNNPAGIGIGSQSPSIIRNNIFGNQYNLYLLNSANVNASYNWWGTTDTQSINQTIYDFKDDFNLGTVNFVPFLNASNSQAPTYSNATPKTWIVDSQGSGDFTSIQAAINASNSGDTIYIERGTYFEHPLVTKTLNLIGQSRSSTIIDGQAQDRQLTAPGLIPESSGSIIAIVANGVTVSGFTIENSRAGGSAIWLQGYNYTTISNNTIANNGDGIRVLNSTGNTINGNTIRNNPYTSIGFDSSYNNSVISNMIANNYIGIGAGVPSYNNTFSYNNVTSNSYGFYLAMYNSTFFRNNISNNVQVAFYGTYSNNWDNGVAGNFWSDYRSKYPDASQIGSSGIGNTPYVIDSNNKDNYPLWTTQNNGPTPIPNPTTTPTPTISPTPSPSPSSSPTPLPTAAPTPTLSPTATPTPTPSLVPKLAPSLAVSCQSSSTYSNFKVDINGHLIANGTGLPDSSVQLSYSIDGGNSWIALTLVNTDNNGGFTATWTPSVTGNYFLKAVYTGNSVYTQVTTLVNFAVLPFQENNVFSVASNSTISAFAFNSTSEELSFKVSGESGTTGYVDVFIPRSLMSDASNLKVYLDGNILTSYTESQSDTWLVSFTYHHSTHDVTMNLGPAQATSSTDGQLGTYVIGGVAIAIIAIVAVVLAFRKRRIGKS